MPTSLNLLKHRDIRNFRGLGLQPQIADRPFATPLPARKFPGICS
jgi:hypothetical protein